MTALPVDRARRAANDDPEFRIAARFWSATVRVASDSDAHLLRIENGAIVDARPVMHDAPSDVSITASDDVWREMLAPTPKPFYHDLFAAMTRHGVTLFGDAMAYYPALRRFVELMRENA